ncbi:MAG: sugar transferase, partial [Armatimonadetes bacterium]|nr:sugar transferase [Armatimonadota bacterium]
MIVERGASAATSGVYPTIKRVIDLVVGVILLLLLSPLLAIVALVVRLDSAGPALYRQERVGRGGSRFTMLKFRTMKVGTPV